MCVDLGERRREGGGLLVRRRRLERSGGGPWSAIQIVLTGKDLDVRIVDSEIKTLVWNVRKDRIQQLKFYFQTPNLIIFSSRAL